MSRTRPGRDAPPRLADYAHERATFSIEVADRCNPVLDIVETWAAEDPEAPAVLSLDAAGEVIRLDTAADLARGSRVAARALLAAGVGKGDRVLVVLPRVPEWYEVMLGAMRIGAVPIPGPNLLTPKDLAFRLGATGASAVVTDAPGATKVDATGTVLTQRFCVGEGAPDGWSDWAGALADAGDGATPEDPTGREDPLLLYFTSGTVSQPKMVEHTQEYGFAHISTARFWHDLRPGDVHWTLTDTGWAKAAWGTLFGQFHERACVVQADLGRPDAALLLGIIERHAVTSLCAPPTLYRTLVQADFSPFDLSALRHCTSAGEPLNPEVIRAWKEGTGGLVVHDGYGQTETAALVANYRSVDVRPGSMGLPVPGWDLAVLDDELEPAGPGVVGHVAVRHDPVRPVGLFHGYLGDDGATDAVFKGPWYLTGDKAAMDADGFFWFEGRGDDVITSSAYRIGPFEVESALIEHAAVAESAVVGKPDPERTEIVVAFVILAPGHEPSDELAKALQDHVKALTAPYKYPREIHFVPELPKTVSGKIRRSELRASLA